MRNNLNIYVYAHVGVAMLRRPPYPKAFKNQNTQHIGNFIP
jgi:hypothetical protein